MQPTLFILGFLSAVGAVFFAAAGQTNTDVIMAGIAFLALLICLAGIGIIAAIDRACENQDVIAEVLRKIVERRTTK
jgi:hypothetical protein